MTLRVLILGETPGSAASLARLVRASGHHVVTDAPDVVLAEAGAASGPQAVPIAAPVVVIGGAGEPEMAGHLSAAPTTARLDAALRAAASGLIVREPAGEPAFRPIEVPRPLLTPRELEILATLGEGLSNKEAARRLGISMHTVKFHVEAILRKLGASSRAEAVAIGLRAGIVEL